MKRNLTLISTFVLTVGVAFGQNIGVAAAKKQPNNKLELSTSEIKSTPAQSIEKAGGDIIWESGFEDAAEWISAGPVAVTQNNGWSIGNSVAISWAFGAGAMGTTGNFARFVNNDPTANTQVNDGPWTLTFDGTIDLTGVPVPHLEFDQFGARFVDNQEVQISLNGTDWVTVSSNNDIDALTAAGGSAYPRPMFRRFNIASYLTGDISNVRIRLFWDGGLNGGVMTYVTYGWFVDNIRIVEGYDNDVKMNYAFATLGSQQIQYTKIPSTQVTANSVVTFGSVFENAGASALDVYMDVTTTGYTGESNTVSVASLATDSLEVITANGFTIPATVGTYNFTYTLQNANPTTGVVASLDNASLVAGSGYENATVGVTGGSGSGLTVNITAGDNGVVTALEDATLVGGTGYSDDTDVATTTDGNGTDLTVDITVSTATGEVLSLAPIANGGELYESSLDVATTTAGAGTGLTLDITANDIEATSVSIANGGDEYADNAAATTTAITGTGSGLELDITVDPINAVTNFMLNDPGSSYIDNPTATTSAISGPGAGFVVDITTNAGEVIDAIIVDGGTGYAVGNAVIIDGGDDNAVINILAVDATGAIINATVVNGGAGYAVGDEVSVDGGDGDAVITIDAVDGGEITVVSVNQGGQDYLVGDMVTVTGGNGAAEVEIASVDEGGVITAVVINNAGTGYEVGDMINIDGGDDNAMILVEEVAGGEVLTVTIASAGSGYDVGDVVTIDAGNGDATIEILTVTEIGLENTADDSKVFPFEVTQKIMAVDTYNGNPNSFTGGFFGWAGASGDPGIGTLYEIFAPAQLERVLVGIVNLDAQSAADYVGNSIFCNLYRYNGTEFIPIAISLIHEIQANEFGSLVALQFEDPISLAAGDLILPVATFFDNAEVPIAFAGKSLDGSTLGLAGGDLIGLIGDDNGYTVDAPVVRLDFGTYLSIETSALEASKVVLYPNPASDNATIAYSLNTESTVTIEVRDLAGKLVYSSNEGQLAAGSHSMTISTASMADGMYTYSLVANGAQVTNKFVVKK